jgi:drug/metabolite transporter (DMT)-like permease
MINRAKDRFAEDGVLYLLWGWVVFTCSLAQFVLLHYVNYPRHYLVWFASWFVVIYQVIYLRKRHRRIRVRTYTDHIVGFVWITFLIVIFLVAFLIGRLSGGDYYIHINPVLLALYGIPTFLTGIIIKFNPLIVGGIGCWILSVITTFIADYHYQFLMIPLAMLVAWIIPGYLLRAKYKNQTHE